MTKTFHGYGLACMFAVLFGLLCTGPVSADNIFVINVIGTVGEYTTSGAAVNHQADHGVKRASWHCGVLAQTCLSQTLEMARSANTTPLALS